MWVWHSYRLDTSTHAQKFGRLDFNSECFDEPLNSCSYCSSVRFCSPLTWLVLIFFISMFCSFVETDGNITCSSEKLQKLGWTFRAIEETLRDSVESYKAFGILNWASDWDSETAVPTVQSLSRSYKPWNRTCCSCKFAIKIWEICSPLLNTWSQQEACKVVLSGLKNMLFWGCLALLYSLFFNSAPFLIYQTSSTSGSLQKIWS